MKTTTLIKIKDKTYLNGWKILLKSLNKIKADNEPITLAYILESNGLPDACLVADKVFGMQKELRLFAYWTAKQVGKYVKNKRKFKKIINTVNLYAYSEVSASARASARESAWESTWASDWESAWESAWESTRASARESAWESAKASAWASAWESAWESARASTWASAWESEYNNKTKEYNRKFIEIVCNGILPKKVISKNHF